MELILDIGNTRTKAGLFSAGRLQRHTAIASGDLDALRRWAAPGHPERIAIGRVGSANPHFLDALGTWAPVTTLSGASPAPIGSACPDRATLGVDRWANAVAAAAMFPGRAVLAISLGTCITSDVVDADGRHRGGSISPGLHMRARAMHAFTEALPEVSPPEAPPLLGLRTAEALAAGIHHGILGELRHTIAQVRGSWPAAAVVLTGGDALRYAKALENGIFAHPTLTLLGLYSLLSYKAP